MKKRSIVLSLFLAALAIIGTTAQALAANATFGMIGITRGQTARLNVVDIKDNAHSCLLTLEFHDANGDILASDELEFLPGEAVFLDYTDPDLKRGERVQIRGGTKGLCLDSVLIMTLEVFDIGTGRTIVVYETSTGVAAPSSP